MSGAPRHHAGTDAGATTETEMRKTPSSQHVRPASLGVRRWRRTSRALFALGLLLVLGVGSWQLYASLWTAHAEHAGKALIHAFSSGHRLDEPVRRTAGPATSGSLASCTASAPGSRARHRSTPVHGLLEIPKLGVEAPVEQGMGEAQLAVAVGHNPHSAWPGEAGDAVLYAHDVSYFSSISKLKAGNAIRYVTPCTTYDFKVTSHAVVRQGAPLFNTAGSSVTLVTCWPTDALWFTPDRYLVTATEVSTQTTGPRTATYHEAFTPPSVPVPPGLVSQGVTLTTYDLPMGTLTLTGTPDRAWSQTTEPLLVEEAAVEAFIAGVRSLAEDQLSWWRKIAPGARPPSPLVGAGNPQYAGPTDVVERARGTAVSSVTLTDSVLMAGGARPGRYSMTVDEVIKGKSLTISRWWMTPR